MDRDWRRLLCSPADRNEYCKLELLRAWEPLDCLGPSPDGKEKEAQNGFPYGNEVTEY